MRGLAGVTVAAFMSLTATGALSCTLIEPGPEGRRYYQRQARAEADSVFLARARPRPLRARTELEPLATIEGDRAPARSHLPIDDPGECGFTPPPEGVVIVFARRVRPQEARARPWLWGRWTVLSTLRPSEVVDGELAAALRATARRLGANR